MVDRHGKGISVAISGMFCSAIWLCRMEAVDLQNICRISEKRMHRFAGFYIRGSVDPWICRTVFYRAGTARSGSYMQYALPVDLHAPRCPDRPGRRSRKRRTPDGPKRMYGVASERATDDRAGPYSVSGIVLYGVVARNA